MKSSLCNFGDCVEVEFEDGWVHVSHSTLPSTAAISFTRKEWAAFLAGVKAGEFDLPEEV